MNKKDKIAEENRINNETFCICGHHAKHHRYEPGEYYPYLHCNKCKCNDFESVERRSR